MDSNIKKELIDQLIQLKTEDDESPTMPFPITSATLEVLDTSTIDVHAVGIKVSSIDEPIVNFEHGPNKQYSITLGQYRNRVTVYDVRQKGLNHRGEEIEMAALNLALTFKNGNKMIDFCIKLKKIGYTERRRN